MSYKDVVKCAEILMWGAGGVLEQYFGYMDPSLNIVAVIDSSLEKRGKEYTKKKVKCISPDEIKESQAVIIAIKSETTVRKISQQLERRNIKYCHIFEAVKEYEKVQLEYSGKNENLCSEEVQNVDGIKLHKYIDCFVPIGKCNLKCEYCYIGQKRNSDNMHFYHSPQFIRKALSKKRLKGTALINLCSDGETLLCRELVKIAEELINEGHYISIVTNGIVNQSIEELINMQANLKHIFVKFSFHYLELRRMKLLDTFVKNVNRVYDAGCSISVEITPSDELVPYIEEIKKISLDAFGAFPQITVTRDERVKDFKILSEYSYDEYQKIWGTFDSKMFEFKMKNVGIKRFENCMAGVWSLHLNLESGDLYKCTQNPWIDNIYEDVERPLKLEPVMNKCCLPYCFNCHSYLALGVIPYLETPTYYEVRDRKMKNGKHWVRDEIKEIFEQRLYINND